MIMNDGETGLVQQRVEPGEWLRQAALFDEVDVGRELLSIEEDKAAGKHTGTTLERRQVLFDEICMRLVEGVSQRTIARKYGVGRNTLAAMATRLEAAGKLEPYKKRVSRKLGLLVELGTDLMLERVERGDVPTNVLPVMVGIAFDKRALLENEPTAILGTQGKEEFTQAAYDRWLDALPQAKGTDVTVATDSQSTGKEPNDQ